jgi:hypothetical protein
MIFESATHGPAAQPWTSVTAPRPLASAISNGARTVAAITDRHAGLLVELRRGLRVELDEEVRCSCSSTRHARSVGQLARTSNVDPVPGSDRFGPR